MARLYRGTFITKLFMLHFWGIGLVMTLAIPWSAEALNESPQTFTLDGRLYQTGTTDPLLDGNLALKIQIIDPNGACLLYEEQQTVSTLTTDGYFHINVGSATGSAKRTGTDPGRSMIQIFQNISAITAASVPGQTCTGGAYTPTVGAVRYFRIIVTPSATNVADTLTPDLVIDSVPQAMVAQSVQGLERADILQTSTSASTALTQANLEAVFTTPAYTNLQSILAGNFISTDANGANLPSYTATPGGVTAGDVWYDSTTNQIKYHNGSGVQTVGAGGTGISSLTLSSAMSANGTVAATISGGSATIDLANTGVSAGTFTKVTVDGKGRVTAGTISLTEADIPTLSTAGKVSGNAITAGTISGSTAINTSGNLVSTGTVSGLTVQSTNLRIYNGANYLQFVAPALSGIVNFTLPDNDGNAGDVLTSNGSGVLSWAAGSGATTLAGDVSGPSGTNSVDKIKGKAITAGSVSGQIMIYDGTAWVNNVVSGDATLAYTGNLTLNKVPIAKGGTNATSFGNNRIIASNGTGTALQDFTCTLNQVISFDGSGNAVCANVSSLSASIQNGGNTTAGDISIGTNDNYALKFKVNNNTIAMTISQGGNVGIGTTAPDSKLSVAGNIQVGTQATRSTATERGQLSLGSSYIQTANASANVDWDNGNIQEVSTLACDGAKTLTFLNVKDGAAYSLLLSGDAAHSGACLFAAAGRVFKTSGGAVAPTAGKDVLFTFAVIGNTIIYNMTDNLQ